MTNPIQDSSTVLMVADNEEQIVLATRKLMRLAPGGSKLNKEDAGLLAVASFLTGLNPWNSEIYMTRQGIMIGVAGVRRKAKEMLMYESGNAADNFHVDFQPAVAGVDTDFEDGDIAYVATITDDASTRTWRKHVKSFIDMAKGLGMDGGEVWDKSVALAGPRPSVSAVAVVRKGEQFGQSGQDKWDRHERCKKRAEKWALRKRFTTLLIDSQDIPVHEVNLMDITSKIDDVEPASKQTEKQILSDMGFDEVVASQDGSFLMPEDMDEKWPDTPYAPRILNGIIDLGHSDNPYHVANMLAQSEWLSPAMDDDVIFDWAGRRAIAKAKGAKSPSVIADNYVADKYAD